MMIGWVRISESLLSRNGTREIGRKKMFCFMRLFPSLSLVESRALAEIPFNFSSFFQIQIRETGEREEWKLGKLKMAIDKAERK